MSKKTQDDAEQTAPVDAEAQSDQQSSDVSTDSETETTEEPSGETGDTEASQTHAEEALTQDGEETPPKRGRRWAWGLVVVLLAFLLGGGAVGYWGWQELAGLRQSVTGEVDRLRARLAETEAANKATGKALADAVAAQPDTKGLEAEIAAIRGSLGGFQTALDDLAQASRTSSKELVVSESELLLSMANDRLRFERNVPAAIQGLKAAKRQLVSLESAKYAPVIEQIDVELAALETAPKSETRAIAKELGALAKQVGTLPLTQPDLSPEPQSPESGENDATGWQGLLDSVSSNLSQFIHVRRADGSDMPAVIPAEEDIVRQTLQLVLQNARLAAVRRDVENYQLSLQQAVDMLAQYFAAGDAGVEDTTERVKSLLAKEIDPELPDVSGSLRMLSSLTSGRVATHTSEDASTASGSVDISEASTQETQSTPTTETTGEGGESADAPSNAAPAGENATVNGDTTQ